MPKPTTKNLYNWDVYKEKVWIEIERVSSILYKRGSDFAHRDPNGVSP
jgi:hypothetical protein